MSTTDEQRLREALADCVAALEDACHAGTERNCFACDAFNGGHAALAQQAPTPAFDHAHPDSWKYEAKCEPVTPVDARDALIGEINNLAHHGAIYLQEHEPHNARRCFADIISKIEAYRAAAPAEGA